MKIRLLFFVFGLFISVGLVNHTAYAAAPPLHFGELPGIFDSFMPLPAPTPIPPVMENIVEAEPLDMYLPEPDMLPSVPQITEPTPQAVELTPQPEPPAPAPVMMAPVYPRGIRDIAGHWAEQAVVTAFDRGMVNINPENMLARPGENTTRGEFVLALDRWITANNELLYALGFASPGTPLTVLGVPDNHPFFPSINSLAQRGMIGGEAPFMPDEFVSRQEISRIFFNLFLRLNNSGFEEVFLPTFNTEVALLNITDAADTASWARDSVAVMFDRNLMSGYADGSFRPTTPMTRAETYSTFQNVERWLTGWIINPT